jgi:predicted nucleotidyltransferase
MATDIAAAVVETLREIEGTRAIALGGSYARGTQHSGSDIDLGLYYREASPFSVEALRSLAEEISDSPEPVVTDFGRWGRWVNGGAWLVVKGQRLDLLYRSIDAVVKTIEECRQGRFESDYYQQVPYGFHSYIYLGELSICKPLRDPEGILADLKERIVPYPEPLKRAIVSRFLWDAEFTLPQAAEFAARSDAYNAVGCMTRAVSALVQVIYAMNERYFVHDKGALGEIERFENRPAEFSLTVTECLSSADSADTLAESVQRLNELRQQVVRLCEGLYARPDFRS